MSELDLGKIVSENNRLLKEGFTKTQIATLLNYKGEKLFENISEYNLYNDQKIIEIVTENKYVIYEFLGLQVYNIMLE